MKTIKGPAIYLAQFMGDRPPFDNEPGKFTTFIAYEWTAEPYGANLHRNVIFEGNAAPYPFTSLDSREPQDLWDWLETIRKNGFEALAIPHNGNAVRQGYWGAAPRCLCWWHLRRR